MATATEAENSEVTVRESPRADDFFAAVRDTNPFAANRVTEPSRYDVDVPVIHAAGFDRLVKLAGQALRERSGVGAVLLGGAGVGKSHLLSRLYRWANEAGQAGGPRACYVYLHNILADPDRLPRYLLKYVVSRLSGGGRGPLHQTPLYSFVASAFLHAQAKASENKTGSPQPPESMDAYRTYFVKSLGARDVYEVLLQFLRHARPEKAGDPSRRRLASSAVAWLSGDEVDPEVARTLGLTVEGREPAMLRDDHEVEQVLLALAQLAIIDRQPFILCIDQVDNIDPDKLRPLSRFLHALLDHAENLLVITSGVKETLLGFKEDRIIPEAAWDRIAQYTVDLKRVKQDDARKILEARLERFHEPFMGLEPVRRRALEDTLFPIGRPWLDTRLGGGIEFRPRDILTWARDAWEDEQARLAKLGDGNWIETWPGASAVAGREPPDVTPLSPDELERRLDETIDRKIEEQVARHRLEPGSLPPDAGNLAGLVETLLDACRVDGLPYTFRGVERMKKKGPKLPPYDLLVRERRGRDGSGVTTGVLFVTNVGLSATAALRRLLEDEHPPDHRLLVTDQERRPLKVGEKGVEYYHDLKKLGPSRFEHLKIDFEAYARLDALREVVAMARSGDLEVETTRGTSRPVSEAEVIASHHRRDRFRRHPLLRPLLTEDAPLPEQGPAEARALDENDLRQYVMAQLAWRMGTTAQAITIGYLETLKGPGVKWEDAWPQVKAVAERMHAEGLVHATPHDDDLFLLLKR